MQQVAYDEIGEMFIGELRIPTRGAEQLSGNYGMLKSMSKEQMDGYTPEQLAGILENRDHCRTTAVQEQDRARFERIVFGASASKMPVSNMNSMMSAYNNLKPWVASEDEVCQFLGCHRCFPSYKERTGVELSIDAVLKGDIPAMAAVGYGFRSAMARPVTDANIVKNLGCRPVPLKRSQPADPNESQDDLKDFLQNNLDTSKQSHGIPRSPAWANGLPALTASTTGSSDTTQAVYDYSDAFESAVAQLGNGSHLGGAVPELSFAHEPSVAYSSDVTYADMNDTLEEARETPLPSSTDTEDLALAADDEMTAMEEAELTQHVFGRQPLEVPHGVAVTEESVELHVADIITQV